MELKKHDDKSNKIRDKDMKKKTKENVFKNFLNIVRLFQIVICVILYCIIRYNNYVINLFYVLNPRIVNYVDIHCVIIYFILICRL